MDMQNRRELSRLRRKLLELTTVPAEDIGIFLADAPMRKGTVYTLRRKCSKPSCRCARGQLHESLVLTASIAGKTRLWTIPKEEIDAVRRETERYRRFRRSRAALAKRLARRQVEMLRVIDAIEGLRTKQS
jgi:hypothetical protein